MQKQQGDGRGSGKGVAATRGWIRWVSLFLSLPLVLIFPWFSQSFSQLRGSGSKKTRHDVACLFIYNGAF